MRSERIVVDDAGFRSDIEGIRGVAVLVVVLFHIGVAGFDGGFVGVDVFFVLSGFLIAKRLFDEIERTGRVRLVAFWARRLRRLTPMLFVTILATRVASLLVYSPLAWKDIAGEARWSSVYLSNVRFAADGVKYFANAQSPYLQTWSLGVEEQFYLLWPLLFIGLAGLAKVARPDRRRRLAIGVAAVSLISFVLGAVLTARGTPWAFFSAPSRAWEFGAGALLYLVTLGRWSPPRKIQQFAGWSGVGLFVLSLTAIDELTPMPGTAALVPVASTVLLVAAGSSSSHGPSRLLRVRPLRTIGECPTAGICSTGLRSS